MISFRAVLVVIFLSTACSRTDTKRTSPPSPGHAEDAEDAEASQPRADAAIRRNGDASAARSVASPIPASSRQLIVALSQRWNSPKVRLRTFERDASGSWKQVGTDWQGTVGRAGLGWGIGYHGQGPPPGMHGPIKREGDKRAAAGVFAIGRSYGYAAQPPATTKIQYTTLGPNWRCVDDPRSRHYNQILNTKSSRKDWTSAEVMRRRDHLYTWVIEIDHNRSVPPRSTNPIPGAGSCIFFHVWRRPLDPTIGCTAMARSKIESMMAWLLPSSNPTYVVLPQKTYQHLQSSWQLPKIVHIGPASQ